MKSSVLLGCVAACLLVSVGAQAQDKAAAEMVEIEVRFMKATAAQATDILIPALNFSAPGGQSPTPPAVPDILAVSGVFTADQASATFTKLKKAGAAIESIPRIIALNGRRAAVQNVREFRYPSEYSKPDAAGKVVPVAFETAPIGLVLEFEANTGPEGTIDLVVSAQISALTGYADYSRKAQNPNDCKSSRGSPVWQPVIKRQEVTTNVTIYSGQTLLLSGPRDTETDRAQYIFITVREVSAR